MNINTIHITGNLTEDPELRYTPSGLLLILLLLATMSESKFGRAVALGCQGFGLALLVALVFIFDEPFKGQISVSPEPIVTVVTGMQARSS